MGNAILGLLLLTCLLELTSQRIWASHVPESVSGKAVSEGSSQASGSAGEAPEKIVDAAAAGAPEGKQEGAPKPGSVEAEKPAEEKGDKRTPFPVGHKIDVKVHYGVFSVERKAESPEVLTVSLQLPDGSVHPFGFVPMSEVTAMVEEAQALGSGISPALLDAKFLSYAFDQTGFLDPLKSGAEATKLMQQLVQGGAQAEEQGKVTEKEQSESSKEDVEEDDGDEGDGEDEEEEDEEEEGEENEQKGGVQTEEKA